MTDGEDWRYEDSAIPRSDRSGTIGLVQVETLEQLAKRLGWSPERLAQARVREAEAAKEPNLTEHDHARAEALSNAMKRTRRSFLATGESTQLADVAGHCE